MHTESVILYASVWNKPRDWVVCVISSDSSYGKSAAYRDANSKCQESPDKSEILKNPVLEDVLGGICFTSISENVDLLVALERSGDH